MRARSVAKNDMIEKANIKEKYIEILCRKEFHLNCCTIYVTYFFQVAKGLKASFVSNTMEKDINCLHSPTKPLKSKERHLVIVFIKPLQKDFALLTPSPS